MKTIATTSNNSYIETEGCEYRVQYSVENGVPFKNAKKFDRFEDAYLELKNWGGEEPAVHLGE